MKNVKILAVLSLGSLASFADTQAPVVPATEPVDLAPAVMTDEATTPTAPAAVAEVAAPVVTEPTPVAAEVVTTTTVPAITSFDQIPTVTPTGVAAEPAMEVPAEQAAIAAEPVVAEQPAVEPVAAEVAVVEEKIMPEPVQLMPEAKPEEQLAPLTIKDKEALMQKLDEVINRLMTLENLVIQQKMSEEDEDEEGMVEEDEFEQDVL